MTIYSKKELEVHPSEYSVVLIEPVLNDSANRKKMCEFMFEIYGVQSLSI